jgi:Ca2+-binding EF-hand superfamily protein
LPRRPGAGEALRPIAFEQLLKQFDLNEDGKIEKSEVPPRFHAQFDRLDRNKDGVVTEEDFRR